MLVLTRQMSGLAVISKIPLEDEDLHFALLIVVGEDAYGG